jgi:hypothetical protein
MKKILLTMFVFGISLFISSMAIAAPNHGDLADCDGLEGQAYELCESYCFAKNCASDDPNGNPQACAANKANYEKVTGEKWLPCDMVACALCGDPDICNQQNTKGVCVDMKSVDCPAEALNVGEVPCDVVTIPADVAPGCSQIPAFWGLIPDCQYTGPAWVCAAFIGGVTVDKCPAPPTCRIGCAADDDCHDGFACVDGECAAIPDGCFEDGDCDSLCVCAGENFSQCIPQPASCDEDGDCGTSDVCEGGVCVECRADEACGENNFCVDNSCVDCISDETCSDQPDKPYCVGNSCKVCLTDADCEAPKPYCRTANNTCVVCATDADCEEGQFCRPNGSCRNL